MRPNGITHVHAITLQTFDPKKNCPEKETIFIPDKLFHEIKTALRNYKE